MKAAFCFAIVALIYHLTLAEGFFTKGTALRAKRNYGVMETSGATGTYGSSGATGLNVNSGYGLPSGGSYGSSYGSAGVSSGAMTSGSVSYSGTSSSSVCCCVICCWFNIMC